MFSLAQNKELQQTIDALRKEIRDQQDVTDNRHSRNATFNVLDVSMDNPNNILSPPRGETMGEIVTLQLRQEIGMLYSLYNIINYFFQILWKSRCHILVTFPSH